MEYGDCCLMYASWVVVSCMLPKMCVMIHVRRESRSLSVRASVFFNVETACEHSMVDVLASLSLCTLGVQAYNSRFRSYGCPYLVWVPLWCLPEGACNLVLVLVLYLCAYFWHVGCTSLKLQAPRMYIYYLYVGPLLL